MNFWAEYIGGGKGFLRGDIQVQCQLFGRWEIVGAFCLFGIHGETTEGEIFEKA